MDQRVARFSSQKGAPVGEFVTVTTDERGVATIRLDRPPVNALNRQIWRELGEAAATCTDDDAVGAVVIWGGPKVFAARVTPLAEIPRLCSLKFPT